MATLLVGPGQTFTSLQAAIDSAVYGDTIIVTAGAVFGTTWPAAGTQASYFPTSGTPSGDGKIILRNKGASSGAYITIQSSALASLPQPVAGQPWTGRVYPGRRTGPVAYEQYMPKVVGGSGPSGVGGDPVLVAEAQANHYKLIGLEICPAYPGRVGYYLVRMSGQLDDGDSTLSSDSQLPHDIIFDRCYIHSLHDTTNEQLLHGMELYSLTLTIINSYLSGFASASSGSPGGDCHALIPVGPGPFIVTNNYLEGVSQSMLFGRGSSPYGGGATSAVGGGTGGTGQTLVSYNTFSKAAHWNSAGGSYRGPTDIRTGNTAIGLTNYPSATFYGGGGTWFIKDLFEIKYGINITVDHNIGIQFVDQGDQFGPGLFINLVDYSTVEKAHHVTFTNNVLDSCGIGWYIGTEVNNFTPDAAFTPHDITLRNNLFTNLSTTPDLRMEGAGAYGMFKIALSTNSGPANNIQIDHNTGIPASGNSFGFVFVSEINSGSVLNLAKATAISITNNLGPTGLYGFETFTPSATANNSSQFSIDQPNSPVTRIVAGNVLWNFSGGAAGTGTFMSAVDSSHTNSNPGSQPSLNSSTLFYQHAGEFGADVSITAVQLPAGAFTAYPNLTNSAGMHVTDSNTIPGADISKLSWAAGSTTTPTTTTVASSVNPSILGQSVTFTANVTGSGATGTVTFLSDGANIAGIGPVTLGSGQASATTSTLTVGTHTITANYSGDANFSGSGGTLAGGQVVNSGPTTATTTAIGAITPVPFPQTMPVTATVTPQSGTLTPTGSVSMTLNGHSLGTLPLNATGNATFNVLSLRVGTYTFIATYIPTGAFSASTSLARTGTVNGGPTTTAFQATVPPEPITQGQNAIINILVTSP